MESIISELVLNCKYKECDFTGSPSQIRKHICEYQPYELGYMEEYSFDELLFNFRNVRAPCRMEISNKNWGEIKYFTYNRTIFCFETYHDAIYNSSYLMKIRHIAPRHFTEKYKFLLTIRKDNVELNCIQQVEHGQEPKSWLIENLFTTYGNGGKVDVDIKAIHLNTPEK